MIDATIATMKAYRPGTEWRRAILQELRRRELGGLPPPSVARLARDYPEWPRSTLSYHAAGLVRLGWATVTTGRNGAIQLTDLGRNVADML